MPKCTLEKCVEFAPFYIFLLENGVCPFKMYRRGCITGKHKKRDLAIFWWDRHIGLNLPERVGGL